MRKEKKKDLKKRREREREEERRTPLFFVAERIWVRIGDRIG